MTCAVWLRSCSGGERCAIYDQYGCQDTIREVTYTERVAFEVASVGVLEGEIQVSSAGDGWRLAHCDGRRSDI